LIARGREDPLEARAMKIIRRYLEAARVPQRAEGEREEPFALLHQMEEVR
jgi:hypothetical protein